MHVNMIMTDLIATGCNSYLLIASVTLSKIFISKILLNQSMAVTCIQVDLRVTIRRMSNLPYHGLHKFVKKNPLVIHVPQHDLKMSQRTSCASMEERPCNLLYKAVNHTIVHILVT